MLHAVRKIFLGRFYNENPLGNHISVTVLSCLSDCKPIVYRIKQKQQDSPKSGIYMESIALRTENQVKSLLTIAHFC